MKKILYDKKISFENDTYSYFLKKEGERIVLNCVESRKESVLFRASFDVSGLNPSHLIPFLDELVNTQTQPSFFEELLNENPQFFFFPLKEV